MVSRIFSRKLFLSVFIFSTATGAATVTRAGFQWVPVPQAAPAAEVESPEVLGVPDLSHEAETPEPVSILKNQTADAAENTENSASAAPTPLPPMDSDEPVMKIIEVQSAPPVSAESNVIMPADAPDSAMKILPDHQRAPVSIAVKPDMSKPLTEEEPLNPTIVVGFGTDMPLALALGQVVPAEYAFSFGPDVNPGYRVSWSGGNPWDQVVTEMIAPLDLVPVIRGNVIHIKNISAAKTSAITPPEQNVQMAGETLKPAIGEPVLLNRNNITDPGESPQQQRAETIMHIQELAESHDMQKEPELIEPAGYSHSETRFSESAEADLKSPAFLTKGDGQNDVQFWEAQKGDSLKATLAKWSAQTNTVLVWEAKNDYTLKDDVFVSDTFTNTIKMVFKDMIEGDTIPTLRLVNSKTGDEQRRLVVGG